MSRNVTVFSLTPAEFRAYRAVCKEHRHVAQAGRAIFAAGLEALRAAKAAPVVDVTLGGSRRNTGNRVGSPSSSTQPATRQR